MTTLREVVGRGEEFVLKGGAFLNDPALRSFVHTGAIALGVQDTVKGIIAKLQEALKFIGEKLRVLIEPVRQANAITAVLELMEPLVGALGRSLGAFTIQLADLGIPIPKENPLSTDGANANAWIADAAIFLGEQLPLPVQIERLARAIDDSDVPDSLWSALEGLRDIKGQTFKTPSSMPALPGGLP